MIKISQKHQKGAVLITALFVAAIAFMISTAFIASIYNQAKIVEAENDAVVASYLAESGLNRTMVELTNLPFPNNNPYSQSQQALVETRKTKPIDEQLDLPSIAPYTLDQFIDLPPPPGSLEIPGKIITFEWKNIDLAQEKKGKIETTIKSYPVITWKPDSEPLNMKLDFTAESRRWLPSNAQNIEERELVSGGITYKIYLPLRFKIESVATVLDRNKNIVARKILITNFLMGRATPGQETLSTRMLIQGYGVIEGGKEMDGQKSGLWGEKYK